MKKRAFIAAPLIGTLIFLISIIIIINFGRSESAAISETVSDSYHNRLVSIVEIYRADLGSLFNIGLQRNIEYALTSQCWQNFISLASESSLGAGGVNQETMYNGHPLSKDHDPTSPGVVTEEEERFYTCARTTELMREVVCIKNSSYLFGLPKWAEIISDTTSFEGIKLQAANWEQFQQFIGYNDAEATSQTGICKDIVSNIELDCKKFSQTAAAPEYQCCSKFDANDNCEPDSIVKGCESGNQFYVRITVQTPAVYGKFPRVLATDNAGNQIRAGAITDVDYDAPISYPFFKYLDAAFKFNHRLAFGTSDVGARRGIVYGSCVGNEIAVPGAPVGSPPEGCPFVLANGYNFPTGVNYGSPAFADVLDARNNYASTFFTQNLKKACDEVKPGISTSFKISGLGNELKTCEEVYAAPTLREFQDAFQVRDEICEPATSKFCAFIENLNREVVFTDNDRSTQVKADRPNEFCWYSAPAYFPHS